MANIPTITFSNGHKMPMIGLGTLKSDKDIVQNSVEFAIDLGYRFIDTVLRYYNNGEKIGEAIHNKIKDGTVTREDLFISTKLWGFHQKSYVVTACRQLLDELGLDYVDLFSVHWPYNPNEAKLSAEGLTELNFKYLNTWRGMEECVRQGLVRSIGVSNFNSEKITRLLESAEIPPVNNQVEVNVLIHQEELIDFCNNHHITVTSYSPLLADTILDNNSIKKRYDKTRAQIALRFVLQQGAVPIPTSVRREQIEENMKIFDFKLTSDDMSTIRQLSS